MISIMCEKSRRSASHFMSEASVGPRLVKGLTSFRKIPLDCGYLGIRSSAFQLSMLAISYLVVVISMTDVLKIKVDDPFPSSLN